VENEANIFPIADLSRMRIRMSNECNEVHKDFLKEDHKKGIHRDTILMEEPQKRLKKNIQTQFKEY
jgi:hypothetical protein